jgi:endogenous inhibitor of DNA gyrase (YacG/DUF329 family)
MSRDHRRPSDRQAPEAADRATEKGLRCPLCGRPRAATYRPFCSARCRDLDLARWFGEAYAVPAVEPGYDEDEGEPG